jgi:hypothetical protein
MQGKMSTEIKALAIVNMLIGLPVGVLYFISGSIELLKGIFRFFVNHKSLGIWGIIYFLIGSIFLMLFLSGLWMLQSKPKGRKLGLYVSLLIGIPMFLGFSFLIYSGGINAYEGMCLPYLIFSFLLILNSWFLSRSKIKKQFK